MTASDPRPHTGEDAGAEPAPGDTVIGLDVGDARIGVAAGRVGSGFAFGRGVVEARDRERALRELRALAEREGARRFVVGLPRRTDGRPSRQAERTRAFAARLRAAGFAVEFEDERFTSEIARRNLVASGLPRGRRREKGRIDEGAARLILESWLRRYAPPPPPPPGLEP